MFSIEDYISNVNAAIKETGPTGLHHPEIIHTAAMHSSNPGDAAVNLLGLKAIHSVVQGTQDLFNKLDNHAAAQLVAKKNIEQQQQKQQEQQQQQSEFRGLPVRAIPVKQPKPQPPEENGQIWLGVKPPQPKPSSSWLDSTWHGILSANNAIGQGLWDSTVHGIPDFIKQIPSAFIAAGQESMGFNAAIEGSIPGLSKNNSVYTNVPGAQQSGTYQFLTSLLPMAVKIAAFIQPGSSPYSRSNLEHLIGQGDPNGQPWQRAQYAGIHTPSAVEWADNAFRPNGGGWGKIGKDALVAGSTILKSLDPRTFLTGATLALNEGGLAGLVHYLAPAVLAALTTKGAGTGVGLAERGLAAAAERGLTKSSTALLDGSNGLTVDDFAQAGRYGAMTAEQQAKAVRSFNSSQSVRMGAAQRIFDRTIKDPKFTNMGLEEMQQNIELSITDEIQKMLKEIPFSKEQRDFMAQGAESIDAKLPITELSKNLAATIRTYLDSAGKGEKTFSGTTLSAAKRISAPISGLMKAGSAPQLARFQIAGQMSTESTKYYEEAKTAHTSFGQEITKMLTGNNSGLLSGTIDGIVMLLSPAPMLGRSYGAAKGAGRLITGAADLEHAFANNKAYRTALQSMVGQNVRAADIAERFPGLSNIAVEISKINTDIESVHKLLYEIVDAESYTRNLRVPTRNLYGQLRDLRNSENKTLQFIGRQFTQLPFSFRTAERELDNKTIALGLPEEAPKIASLFRSLGFRPPVVKMIVDDFLHAGADEALQLNIIRNAYKELYWGELDHIWASHLGLFENGPLRKMMSRVDMEAVMRGFKKDSFDNISAEEFTKYMAEKMASSETGKIPEMIIKEESSKFLIDDWMTLQKFYDEHEELYNLFRQRVDQFVDNLVDLSGGSKRGTMFAIDSDGKLISDTIDPNIVKDEVTGATVNTSDARGSGIVESHLGEISMPSIKAYSRSLRTFLKNLVPEYSELVQNRLNNYVENVASCEAEVSMHEAILAGSDAAVKTAVERVKEIAKKYNIKLYGPADAVLSDAETILQNQTPDLEQKVKNIQVKVSEAAKNDTEYVLTKQDKNLQAEWKRVNEAKTKIKQSQNLESRAQQRIARQMEAPSGQPHPWDLTHDDWYKQVAALKTKIVKINKKQTQRLEEINQDLIKNYTPGTPPTSTLRQYHPTKIEQAAIDEHARMWPDKHLGVAIHSMNPRQIHHWIVNVGQDAGFHVADEVVSSSIPEAIRNAIDMANRVLGKEAGAAYLKSQLPKIEETLPEKFGLKSGKASAAYDLSLIEQQEARKQLSLAKTKLAGEQTAFNAAVSVPKELKGWAVGSSNNKILLALKTTDWIDKWYNEMIFKRLALFSLGWAERVSLSELFLNVTRLGPRQIAGGAAAASIANRTRKAIETAADVAENRGGYSAMLTAEREKELIKELHPSRLVSHLKQHGISVGKDDLRLVGNFVRGMVISADEVFLNAIGLPEFVNAASYLAFMHEPWLPSAVNGEHSLPLEDADMLVRHPGIIRDEKGKIKTKKVQFGKEYRTYSLDQSGFFLGMQRQAATLGASTHLGQPIARAYQQLYNMGRRGTDLQEAAIEEAINIIDRMPSNLRNRFDRVRRPAATDTGAYDSDPIRSWANVEVRALEGSVLGRGLDATNKPVNELLLDDIANGTVVDDLGGFYKKYATQNGKQLESWKLPSVTMAPEFLTRKNIVSQIFALGHEKVLRPTIEHLVRMPVFVAEFAKIRSGLDDKVVAGIINNEQANLVAQTEAARNMIKYIHNPMDKTAFEYRMRILAPFYFAQNQAWRRMGRLFASDPGAFMQYFELMMGVQKWAAHQTDENGMSIFTIPGTQALNLGIGPFGIGSMANIPLTGSLSSIATVDPLAEGSSTPHNFGETANWLEHLFAPKFGPLATLPGRMFADNKQLAEVAGATPVVGKYAKTGVEKVQGAARDWVVGPIGAHTPMWEAFVPNTVLKQLMQLGFHVAGMDKFGITTQILQAQIESERAVLYEDMTAKYNELLKSGLSKNLAGIEVNLWAAKRYSDPAVQQELLGRASRMATGMWTFKMLVGMVTPIPIGMGKSHMEVVKQYEEYSKPKSQGGKGLVFPENVKQFYLDHPNAVAMTVSKSKSPYGVHVDITKNVARALDENSEFFKKNPSAGFAFVPYDLGGAYYQPANTALMDAGLRERMMPDEFINQFLISMGNALYFDKIKPSYETQRLSDKSAAYQWRQKVLDIYGVQYNPIWYSQFQSGAARTERLRTYAATINLAKTLAPKGIVPDSPEDKKLAKTNPQAHIALRLLQIDHAVWPSLKKALDDAKVGRNGLSYDAVRAWWQTLMTDVAKKDPLMKNAITTVLMDLG